MSALVNLFIKYLPVLIQASQSVPEVMTFVSNVHAIFKRDKLWTPRQEERFDDKVEALKDDPYWKPEV